MLNSTKMLYMWFNKMVLTILIFSLMIVFSSSTWFSMWIGLELNTMSFIPLLLINNSLLSSESSMKYFLIQAMASNLMIFSSILLMSMNSNMFSFLMVLAMMMKMGVFPFYQWYLSIMNKISWKNIFLIMTIQKFSPLYILYNCLTKNYLMWIIIMINSLISVILAFNNMSMKKIMACSSMNHMSWIMSSLVMNISLMMNYMLVYFIILSTLIYLMNFYNINSLNDMFLLNNSVISFIIMSLMGLPPLSGFIIKWYVIQYLLLNNLMVISLIMILSSLISMYFYLRLTWISFMFFTSSPLFLVTKNFVTLKFIILIIPSTMMIPISFIL
uniref:NADH-ubiquinone oxidoreductase chain 2 n=1 Tax=Colossendeis brevirostris TaxID=619823 RepID=A0A9E8ABN5_9CHEL|nr:NADH dehydrogenase subunit 2 [Colossendeis brevirostris]UYX57802.1 NADH dehydrogenase subunit 2 [Colossendeis brevirostris]